VQFALALNEYDVLKHQPHPPGYILYVVLGRIRQRLAPRPDGVLRRPRGRVQRPDDVRRLLSRRAPSTIGRPRSPAAALLAVSPLFWFYGSVGLTYAGEALFASTVAYFGFRALNGGRSDAYLAAWYWASRAACASHSSSCSFSALDRLRGVGACGRLRVNHGQHRRGQDTEAHQDHAEPPHAQRHAADPEREEQDEE